MTRVRPPFWSQAVLLVAAVMPLSLAERQSAMPLVWQWFHLGLVLAAVGAGAFALWMRRYPLLGPRVGYVTIIAAFGLLLIELFESGSAPVMALSHFLILVCVCRLLQDQTPRDQAQFYVLTLLLLIVAAIVSGNLLFPVVLALYLTVGIRSFIQLHLAIESARVSRHNRAAGTEGSGEGHAPRLRAAIGPLLMLNLVMLVVGAVLFVLFPRVGGGMLGHVERRAYAGAITGLAGSLTFERVGPIQMSERQVMTVKIEDEFGHSLGPEVGEPYFRSMVFDQYGRGSLGRGQPWEWRVVSPRDAAPPDVVCRANEVTGEISLIPGIDTTFQRAVLVQKYWLQPDELRYLYSCYPALLIRSRQFSEIRKRISDQTIQVYLPRSTAIRYEVMSAPSVSPLLLDRLAREREDEHQPSVLLPEPPLPRESELRRLIADIDAQAGTSGSLDDPGKRERFVEAVMQFLHSDRFSYTLNPAPVRRGSEPIGDFLLDDRRGHCEYYASALALLCQYRGVPARVVVGYLGGDYNGVGEYYMVRERHAHSWTEVFVPGRDWVRYDPTPPGQGGSQRNRWWLRAYTYVDYLQFQWNNQVVGFDDNVRRALFSGFADWLRRPIGQHTTWMGSVQAFIGEMIFWRAELSPQDRLLYYVFSIMVTALVVLLGYVVLVSLRWLVSTIAARCAGGGRADARPEVEFYQRFLLRLKHLGLQRRPEQTPAEFAEELARNWPAFAPAPELVQAYYGVVFGRRVLPDDHRVAIEAFLQALRSLSPQQMMAAATDLHPTQAPPTEKSN
ncbi:MAG TPA: DUF3488 and DUF4129 domain-containing transglutaminase family protein [Phycisphaerae bacterium]|nr:DUF3488 and DUF4129 domain-containing transglutaminase family protein [Phycisphaerae bacterium]